MGYTLDDLSDVALLAEGVDRNTVRCAAACAVKWSPSSRRAWIEIRQAVRPAGGSGSPSSRRAWIEIAGKPCGSEQRKVALLAEGVDRNTLTSVRVYPLSGRPPRGGRG